MKSRHILPTSAVAGILTTALLLADQPVREVAPPQAPAVKEAGPFEAADAKAVTEFQQFKPLNRLDGGFSSAQNPLQRPTPEAARMSQLLKEQNELFKSEEHRIKMVQLMNIIRLANQQPDVRKKLEEARKEVHDYVRRASPDLLPYLEKMDAPRDLSRKQNQLTELIF
jgi:hypothetical protein